MNTVSENLKRIRQERNLTQQQMADKLFVTQQAVSNWEKGKTMPGVDMLVDIAEKLDVEIYDLLYGVNEYKIKQKKKTIFFALFSVAVYIIYQISFTEGYRIFHTTFQGDLYYSAIYFLRPMYIFFFPYAVVQYYKLKTEPKAQIKFPFSKAIRLFVLVVWIITFAVEYHIIFCLPDILYDFLSLSEIMRKIAGYPWLYAILGAIYSIL